MYGIESLFEQFGAIAFVFVFLKMWMVTDALRTGNDRMWYLIVFLPFGEIAYFILFKLGDLLPRDWWRKLIPVRKSSLATLERAAEHSPSFNNRVAYADALFDRGRYPVSVHPTPR